MRPAREPMLTTRHRQQRLARAKENFQWTLERQKKIVWREESRSLLNYMDGRNRIQQKQHEAMGPGLGSFFLTRSRSTDHPLTNTNWFALHGPVSRPSAFITAGDLSGLQFHLAEGKCTFSSGPCYHEVVRGIRQWSPDCNHVALIVTLWNICGVCWNGVWGLLIFFHVICMN